MKQAKLISIALSITILLSNILPVTATGVRADEIEDTDEEIIYEEPADTNEEDTLTDESEPVPGEVISENEEEEPDEESAEMTEITEETSETSEPVASESSAPTDIPTPTLTATPIPTAEPTVTTTETPTPTLTSAPTATPTPEGLVVDSVNFPDENFRVFIEENIDADGNGYLSNEEISDVVSIDCSGRNISDLTGITLFTNLTYLAVNGNSVTALDISAMPSLLNAFYGIRTNEDSYYRYSSSDNETILCDTGVTIITGEAVPLGTAITADIFPDDGLRSYVMECCDLNGDGYLTDGEIESATDINCSGRGITDLTGIGLFQYTTTINCSGNLLTILDLTSNPNLISVDYTGNPLTAYIGPDGTVTVFDEVITSDAAMNVAASPVAGAHGYCTSLPGNGNVFVQIDGTFDTTSKTDILAQINGYRLEACRNGYPDPRNPSRALTTSDYVPIKWSGSLEEMAMLRAAESSFSMGHVTLNGDEIWSHYYSVRSWNESIAWNYNNLTGGINQWYGERNDWINQTSGAVTGHYTSMIDPSNTYVGVAGFYNPTGYYPGTYVAEYTSATSGIDESKVNVSLFTSQIVAVRAANITAVDITCASGMITANQNATFRATATINLPYRSNTDLRSHSGICVLPDTWSSSNTARLSIDGSGNATCADAGNVTVSCTIGSNIYNLDVIVAEPYSQGWNEINGDFYYVGDDGLFAHGWLELDTGKYYLGEDGARVSGLQTINGSIYFFDGNGIMFNGGLKTVSGFYYYFDANGVALTNTLKKAANGYYYYFGSNGRAFTNGLKTVNGYYYYFASNGRALTNTLKKAANGYYYYFASNGRALTNTLKKAANGYYYYFGSNGKAFTGGLRAVNGYYYYFGSNGRALVNTLKKVDNGFYYYFGSNGRAFTGGLKVINGYYYYFASNGRALTNTLKKAANGYYYYFLSNGRAFTGGWRSINGYWYYFKPNGRAATGTITIGGRSYTFRSNGRCANR